jgi:hypothetical protein
MKPKWRFDLCQIFHFQSQVSFKCKIATKVGSSKQTHFVLDILLVAAQPGLCKITVGLSMI